MAVASHCASGGFPFTERLASWRLGHLLDVQRVSKVSQSLGIEGHRFLQAVLTLPASDPSFSDHLPSPPLPPSLLPPESTLGKVLSLQEVVSLRDAFVAEASSSSSRRLLESNEDTTFSGPSG